MTVANLVISGDLTVSGTTTTVNSNTVTIGDAKIVLNADFSGAGPTENGGFEVERGDEDNVNFIWNETNDNFEFQVGSNAAPVGKVGSIFATQTASSPTALTYSFASDTNTGIQHTGADQLGLVVGNARVLMVNANGVHINPSGASGATNALDVVGDATITGDVDITGSLDVDNLNFNHNTISNTGSNQHIILSPNANADVYMTSDVVLGNAQISATQIGATGRSGAVAGIDLRLYAGSAGAGADPNLAGGKLQLWGGGGKGTGVGGDIEFQVAPPGSSGASYNSMATALTISGNDKSAVFEGAVTVNGNLTVSGTTTTVSSTTVSHADPVLQLNQGETNDANAGVTGSVSGFQVDRGSNSGTDIAITRFVWDDSVDAFRCQIANNAPTNSTFVDTQLRVGTPSDANDAATKGYVDGGAGRTAEAIQDIVGAMFTGNTETNITATYQDSDGTIDLVSTDTNTQLSTEAVQDIVGAMFTSNTETGISATYQDSDGTIDLVVSGGGGGTIGIANGEYLGANANVADNDFLRVDGTLIEGRTAAETLTDIAAMPLAGGTFTGNVAIGGIATFLAPRAVVDDITASGHILIGASVPTVELDRPQAGQVLVASGIMQSVHLPDPGSTEVGDTYVIINTTAGALTIDRTGLGSVGGHGQAQNLNGGTANGSLPSNEVVTLIAITPDSWYGIGL